jgi:hypothetical protein
VNKALSAVYKYKDDHNAYWEPYFVIIDDMSKSYTQATVQLDGKGTFRSPFAGKSLEDVAKAIRSLRLDNNSDLNYVQYMVLDEENIDQDWAWVAFAEDAEDKNDSISVIKVKVGHEIYDSTMLALSAGSPGIDSLLEVRELCKDQVYERRS